jgi:hypothetical protein
MGAATLPRSTFSERLVRLNNLDAAGFAAWDFHPGMRFGERAAWWRGGADRKVTHEGLDLLWYRTGDGGRASLRPGARVPVLWAGAVVAVVPDFLGASVFVAHPLADGTGRRLHSIYGHVEPAAGVSPGSPVRDGDQIGSIAEPRPGSSTVPAHLHLSVALIDRAGGPAMLDWTALQDVSRVLLLDPLPIVIGGLERSP